MVRYVQEQIVAVRPVAIVFDLLNYQYVSGNDVTSLFTASFDKATKKLRPVCIVAADTTRASLSAFLKSAKISDSFGIQFAESVESAVRLLKQRLKESAV